MLHGNQKYSHVTGALVTQTPVCFSRILHNSKSSQKTLKEKVFKLILITPAWTIQVWYPKILNINQESYFAALEKGPSEKSQRGNSSPSSEQDSTTGGLDSFRARLQEEGI